MVDFVEGVEGASILSTDVSIDVNDFINGVYYASVDVGSNDVTLTFDEGLPEGYVIKVSVFNVGGSYKAIMVVGNGLTETMIGSDGSTSGDGKAQLSITGFVEFQKSGGNWQQIRGAIMPGAGGTFGGLPSAINVSDLASGTPGELITWDPGTVATTISAGVSGNVLTSNGANAEPTYEPPTGASSLIGLTDVSGAEPNTGNVFVADGAAFEARQLLESDISDFGTYLTAEVNDLTSGVTWANVPNANITEASVTQHQAALSITESQVSDLQTYLTAEVNNLTSSVTWANVPNANITEGSVTQHNAAIEAGTTNALESATTTVGVSGSVAPTTGQVLTAVSGVSATWQAPSEDFTDSTFRIQDNGDATSELAFQVSAIDTGTTRTIIVPDADVDLTNVNSALQDITGEALGTLSDVTITTNTDGEVLRWNGSAWINNTLAELGAATSAQGATADSALQDITGESLSSLSDATITANTDGETLRWNGSAWINNTLAELGAITASSTDTLTNKTFDANGTGNSLSNVDVADLSVGTDGELITWDSAGNPATVAVGTAAQVLTSNGAGAAPTFQNATVGTVTSVTGGTGIASTGGATPDLSLTVDELAEKTDAVVGTDRLVGTTSTTNWAETISNIPLSIFSDDLASSSHTHVLADGATDVTASAAEINSATDLSGLTAGWVYSADTATTASWKAQTGDPDQNLYETVIGDSGTTTASTITATLDIEGGTGITTTASTDKLTVAFSGALNDLSNVTSTTPAKGDLLAYNGSAWVEGPAVGANDTVLTADSAEATGLKFATPAGGGDALTANGIDQFSDVTITTNTDGETLRWNGSAWINNTLAELGAATAAQGATADSALQDITGEALGTLSDVTITGNSDGETLRWNGSAWINNTLAELGVATAAQGATADSALQSVPSIESITDVTITTNTDGEVLRWNGSAWINNTLAELGVATAAQGSTADSALQDLTGDALSTIQDVTITSIASGELLKWNGSAWINQTLAEAGIQASGSYLTDITGEALSTLSDVTITAIASGEIPKWNGSAWVNNTLAEAGIEPADGTILKDADIGTNVQAYNAALTGTTGTYTTANATTLGTALQDITGEALSTVSDVTITSIASGELLKWNGSAWINQTLAEAGVEPADGTILKDADIGSTVQAYNAALTGTTGTYTTANATTLSTALQPASTDTLTNKTFDANGTGNSITNIDLTADVINDLPVTEGGTGSSTAAGARTNLSAAEDYVVPVIVSGTTDTMASGDHAVTNRYTNASQVTVTIPTDASDDLPDGFWCALFAEGAGGITLSTTSITTPGSPNKTVSQGETLFVQKTGAADTWLIMGGTAA